MRTFLRSTVQIGMTLALTWLFLNQSFINASTPFFTWASWMDPLTGLAGLILRQWSWLALLSLTALVLAFWRRRFFCGWLCPVGALLDLIGIIKRWLIKDWMPGALARKRLGRLRWIILVGIIGFVILGHAVALVFDPLVLWPREIHRLIYRSIPWNLIVLVLLGILTFPRFWCRFLCPTGTLFNLAGRLRGNRREAGESCRGCGLCARRCPMGNIDSEIRFGPDCLDCGICQRVCPDHSIGKPKSKPLPVDENRRGWILAAGVGAGMIGLGVFSKAIPIQTGLADRSWSRLLRPPGALKEEALNAACDRCGECLNICPTQALVPAGLEAGLTGLATPRFVPRKGRCMLDQCNACAQVCPTGALAAVPPAQMRLGTAHIDRERCVAWAKNRRCLICVEVCPTFALKIDEKGHPVLNPEKCVGCGACENNCPVQGSAIRVYNQGEKRR